MHFKAPFTCIVVGATGSGKTQLVKKLIAHRDDLIIPQPQTVLYCYGELNETVLEHCLLYLERLFVMTIISSLVLFDIFISLKWTKYIEAYSIYRRINI
jgi:Cdc6-like AAA superfamily ATPase